MLVTPHCLGGRFGYFLFFLLGGGRGSGSPRHREGGRFGLLKIPGGEGGSPKRGGGGRGAGRVSAGNSGQGWGLNIFFSGPKFPASCEVILRK